MSNIVTGPVRRAFMVAVAVAVVLLPLIPPASSPALASAAGTGSGSAAIADSADPALINTPTATRTPTPINVGNFVWDDLDQDGRQDAGEPGVAGVTVQLWNGAKTQMIATTVTNATGNYTLVAPGGPGEYRVRVVLPSINDQVSPKDNAAAGDSLDSDINPSGANFGFTDIYAFGSNLISIVSIDAGLIVFRTPTATRTPTPINVGNFVWDDWDQDGRQDAGEPGLAGVTVQLWNGAKTQMIATTVTNATGNYSLIAPLPGEYRVRVVLPSINDQFSPMDSAAAGDTLDSDINPSGASVGFTEIYSFASNLISIVSIDAGLIVFRTPTATRTPTPINVGNFVWHDLDHDGRQDAGEPGLAGITVQLWNGAKTQMIATTVTNATGNYSLIAPLPGEYRVRVVLPSAVDTFSPMDAASGDDAADSDINPSGASIGFTNIYSFASNLISISSIDAGIMLGPATATPTRTPTPISVGDFVWNDRNRDGKQDAGEPGLAGVTVELWDSLALSRLDATRTDFSGNYELQAPRLGSYRVRVLLSSAGDQFSPKDNKGAGDEADSDINPSGADSGFSDVFTLLTGLFPVTSIDAGIIPAPPTSTPTATPTATTTVAAGEPSHSPTPTFGPGTPSPTPTGTRFLPYAIRLPVIVSIWGQ